MVLTIQKLALCHCKEGFSVPSPWPLFYWPIRFQMSVTENENAWALTPLPRRALLVSFLAQRRQMMSWRHTWCHTITSCHTIWHDKGNLQLLCWMRNIPLIQLMVTFSLFNGPKRSMTVTIPSEMLKITFFNMATLTFDLQPSPLFSSEIW